MPKNADNFDGDISDYERRGTLLDSMKRQGADTSFMEDKILDYTSYEDFRYVAYQHALMAKGTTVEHLPMFPENALTVNRRSMDALFQATFGDQVVTDTSKLFVGCRDVREKIGRLTELTETQLISVFDDPNLEFAVRKYAHSFMHCGSDEMNRMLDQALGKPLERKAIVSQTIPAIATMDEDQIRKLIESADSDNEAEIVEVEDL